MGSSCITPAISVPISSTSVRGFASMTYRAPSAETNSCLLSGIMKIVLTLHGLTWVRCTAKWLCRTATRVGRTATGVGRTATRVGRTCDTGWSHLRHGLVALRQGLVAPATRVGRTATRAGRTCDRGWSHCDTGWSHVRHGLVALRQGLVARATRAGCIATRVGRTCDRGWSHLRHGLVALRQGLVEPATRWCRIATRWVSRWGIRSALEKALRAKSFCSRDLPRRTCLRSVATRRVRTRAPSAQRCDTNKRWGHTFALRSLRIISRASYYLTVTYSLETIRWRPLRSITS
jgi:hypothetical protein